MRWKQIMLFAVFIVSAAGADTLSGRVTDSSGAGIHPIDIDVFSSSTGSLIPTPDDTTNSQGNYSIALPAGRYDVKFFPQAGAHLFTRWFFGIDVLGTTTLNAALATGQYIRGRVTDANGNGVAMVDLDFHDPTTGAVPASIQNDKSDSTGFFNTLVTSGVWDVSFIAPTAARLVPRLFPSINLTADVDLGTVVLAPGHLVQGTVTDDGFFPIVDADLDVRPAGARSKLFTPQDNTDASGSYALMLPSGVFDISASPAAGDPYASATARSITISADGFVPNLVLPPGFELRGRCQDPGSVRVAGVDVDVDSLPLMRRLETDHDASDGNGDFRVLVAAWKYRVTLSPPVATKLLPVRFDSLQISAPRDLGTITFSRGHWVSGTVVESGSNAPISGANLDFIRNSNGVAAITPGDVTDANGLFKVVTDADLYRVRVVPPSSAWDTLVVQPFRTLNDTVVTFALVRRSGGVSDETPVQAGLSLAAPWPNPASGPVTISFSSRGRVTLDVWDLAGRRVATLHRGAVSGTGAVRWTGHSSDGALLPAGVYLVRLTDGRATVTRRIGLLR